MKASGIGGQALMEGVMMKNGSHYACAVRKPDGTIEVDDQRTVLLGEKCKIFKLPIIRGVVTFIESLIIGVKTLTWSASFFEEEEKNGNEEINDNDSTEESGTADPVTTETLETNGESGETEVLENAEYESSIPSVKKSVKKEKTKAEKRKENILIACLVLFSVVFAVGLFMILPWFLCELLRKKVENHVVLSLLEGLIRITLFVGYVAAISCMKDIKRVFMYHGAEHKSINCVENGYELTVENVRKCSREHKRCGTSFLLIVMVISIIVFAFIKFDNTVLRFVSRIILIPIVAGIAYEFIRLAGRTENKVVAFLSRPGMALQKLTTREPDDSMIECAIASVEAVFDWRAFQDDLKAEEEAKRKENETLKNEKRLKREEEIRRRMEAKGITVEELSEEKIREIDEKADRLAADERSEELGESLAREAADKAKSGKFLKDKE